MDKFNSTFKTISSSKASMILIICVILYISIRFVIYFMQYSLTTGLSTGILLVPGLLDGDRNYVIKQDVIGDQIVGLSSNELHGIEFTYSIWLKINSDNFSNNTYDISNCFFNADFSCNERAVRHVFNKGDNTFEGVAGDDVSYNVPLGIKLYNNAPGLYLAKDGNNVVLLFYMDTFGDEPSASKTPIIIDNIPIMKWISLIVIAKSNVIYIYINGRLKHSKIFIDSRGNYSVFKQNYDDVHVSSNDGTWGKLSDLVYYNRALNGLEIQATVLKGPNKNEYIKSTDDKYNETPFFLSSSWYN